MNVPSCEPEKRHDLRLETIFSVLLETTYGQYLAIARNISTGGMFIETRDPLPLGSKVKVRFQIPDCDDEIVATSEVKNHYFLKYAGRSEPCSLTGMGLRFLQFERETRALLQGQLYRRRVLH